MRLYLIFSEISRCYQSDIHHYPFLKYTNEIFSK